MGYADRLQYEQFGKINQRDAWSVAFDDAHDEFMAADAKRISDMVMEAAEFSLADALIAAVRDADGQLPTAVQAAFDKLHDAICTDIADRVAK